MKYWFDTEFIESSRHLDLISIGIVSEDGRELYLENAEVDWSRASDWVIANVKPYLTGNTISRFEMAQRIKRFIGYDSPEFWGYFADYDWVLFCWLFGRMVDLPKGWPMFCRDVMQYAEHVHCPRSRFPQQEGVAHNALDDAIWTKQVWEYISRWEAGK